MTRRLLLLTLLLSGGLTYGQSLSPQVTGTAGDHFANAGAQLSWTIGEPISETFAANNAVMTQGFHQTEIVVTALEKINPDFAFEVFPNPVAEKLQLKFDAGKEKYSLEIRDIQGKLVFCENINNETNKSIDVSAFGAGVYFLNVFTSENKAVKTFKIQVTK